MKVIKSLLGVGVLSVLFVVFTTSAAHAWHPEGVIVKKVQNVTTGSELRDADTEADAVHAKPGDTLKYVIEVSNKAKADSRGYNDMAKTVMTDMLPAGIELASSPSQRQITENLGVIKPGQKVVKEYLVKVVSKTNGTIKNTACFTGDSKANDNPQKGCNPAVVTVTVPEKPVPPVVPETPEVPETPKPEETPKPQPQAPAELPKTGMTENIIGGVVAIIVASFVVHRYVESRRSLKTTMSNL